MAVVTFRTVMSQFLLFCVCPSLYLALGGDFGDPKYWNDAYASGRASKEWYSVSLAEVLVEIGALLGSSDRLSTADTQALHVGCGVSIWSTGLADLGWNVTNIDSSTAAIAKMQFNIAEHPRSRFRVMDVTSLMLADDSFDVVLDKGTLHAMGSGDASRPLIPKMLAESVRVLRAGGLFVTVRGGVSGNSEAKAILADQPKLRWLGERTIEQRANLARLESVYKGQDIPSYLKRTSYVHIAVAQATSSLLEL